MAEALYRKYRPQIFEDVVGQDHIERTIKNAIEQDKVSHAYLFTGPRGTGKTTTARLLAKALLCEKGPTPNPDGSCDNCQAIASGNHPDVYELDAASRTGVENVREEIIGRVQYAPTQGRYKVYIIDEVHMLSTAAFNALLKTLEEPPSHVIFILATTDPQKVPETIHSRCQRFDFHRISIESIVSRLGAICVAEGVEFEGEALDLIAHRAEGGMRNALTSLEQLIAFGEGKVTMETAERLLGSLDSNDMAEIVTAIGQRDIARCFTWTAQYVETGSDLAQFVRDLAQHMRNMYILSLSAADTVLEVNEVTRRELVQEMQFFSADRLSRMLGVLGDLLTELRTSINPRLSFEIALTRMVRPDSDLTLEALAERVEALESGYSAVAHVSAVPAMPAAVAPVASDSSAPAHTQQAANAQASKPVQVQTAPAAQTQPAPAAQTATQASGVRANLAALSNPAALQRVWQAALQQIKKEKAAYGVLFMNTKASFDEQSKELIIEFAAGNDFAYSAVQKPEAMAIVELSLQKAAGGQLAFRLTKGGENTSPAFSAVAAQTSQVAQVQQTAQTSQAAQAQQPAQQAGADIQDALSQEVLAPEPEDIPLDVYEGYAASGLSNLAAGTAAASFEASSFGQSAANSPSVISPAPMSEPSQQPAQPSQQLEHSTPDEAVVFDEAALESMLSKGFGGEVKLDVIEEE